jgi:Fe-S-cluster containining protein
VDRCAALDPGGRCLIYAARPVVCRSHGAPIRMRERSLPVVQSCHRNFTHTTPDADCILDQETLSALVLAVDRAEAIATAIPSDGTRIDLATLLGTM